MLAVDCASCGGVVTLELASDLTRCGFCDHRAALPPAAAQRVLAARQLLATLDASKRQLSGAQQRALAWSGAIQGCFIALLVVFLLPLLGLAGLFAYIFAVQGEVSWGVLVWLIMPSFLPLVVLLLPGMAYNVVLRGRRRRLERACAAVPPDRPGQPARCHVCGGMLAAAGPRGIARCGYCSADNLVTERAMAASARARAKDSNEIEAYVRTEAAAVGGFGMGGMLLLPLVAIAAPIVSVALWFGAIVAAAQIEGPVDTSVKMVWAQTETGVCLARYDATQPASKRASVSSPEEISDIDDTGPFDGNALVGQRVSLAAYDGGGRLVGEVKRAYSSPLLPDAVYIVSDVGTDTDRREAFAGVCRGK
jgi:hypothetical protein